MKRARALKDRRESALDKLCPNVICTIKSTTRHIFSQIQLNTQNDREFIQKVSAREFALTGNVFLECWYNVALPVKNCVIEVS